MVKIMGKSKPHFDCSFVIFTLFVPKTYNLRMTEERSKFFMSFTLTHNFNRGLFWKTLTDKMNVTQKIIACFK